MRYPVMCSMDSAWPCSSSPWPRTLDSLPRRRGSYGRARPSPLWPCFSGTAIAAYVPWSLAMGLRWIIPEEQPRFVVVLVISTLHLVADGLLLIWLGFRLWWLRPPAVA